MNQHHTFIIPNGLKSAALAKTEGIEEFGGLAGMFKTPLSKSGSLPATHWVSSGWMSEAEVAYLNANLPGPFGSHDGTFEGAPESVWGLFSRLDLKIITPPLT